LGHLIVLVLFVSLNVKGGEKVKKAVLMSIVVLLALSVMAISPVLAKTTEYYYAHHEMDLQAPGKAIESHGIVHIRGSYWKGTSEGSLGTGTLEVWFTHIDLNTVTGEGTVSAKILVTIEGSTLKGISEGKLVDTIYGSGEFLGAQGTGDFEGWRIMGSWSVVFTSATHASIDCVGITMRP